VVLLTNAHVIPKAIQPEDAFLAFRGLEDFTEPGVGSGGALVLAAE
jgi:hypothetical protein